MADEVPVSRGALGGLIAALMLSLMGTAYLLGKQSSLAPPPSQSAQASVAPGSGENPPTPRPLQVGPAPQQPDPQPPAPPPAPTQPVASLPAPSAPVQPDPVVSQPQPPSAPPTPKERPVRVASRPLPAAAETALPKPSPAAPVKLSADPATVAYFAKIDEAMRNTTSMGDSNQFATEILQQALNGNTEGFDNLLETSKATQLAVLKIQAPPPCKEHHRLLNAQLEKSISLLNRVKNATVSFDSAALTSLAGEGRGMQAEADRFKALDERLRQRTP